jgi:succinate dehydrogenase/fumarate reductase-like Fe-S protein
MTEGKAAEKVIIAKVLRFDPATDDGPHFETYEVPKYEVGRQTVSRVLEYIFENIDPSLGYYHTCNRGICNGCVAMINGRAELMCMTETTDEVTIEPMRHHRVIRDLVVVPEGEDRPRRRVTERSSKSRYL